eukprot:1017064-Prymnesium_polylepis.1
MERPERRARVDEPLQLEQRPRRAADLGCDQLTQARRDCAARAHARVGNMRTGGWHRRGLASAGLKATIDQWCFCGTLVAQARGSSHRAARHTACLETAQPETSILRSAPRGMRCFARKSSSSSVTASVLSLFASSSTPSGVRSASEAALKVDDTLAQSRRSDGLSHERTAGRRSIELNTSSAAAVASTAEVVLAACILDGPFDLAACCVDHAGGRFSENLSEGRPKGRQGGKKRRFSADPQTLLCVLVCTGCKIFYMS